MIKVAIIVKTYGSFIVHVPECPWAERDYNQDGKTWYDMDASSVNHIAQDMQELEAPHQSLTIVTKRTILHHCMPYDFPGTTIKAC